MAAVSKTAGVILGSSNLSLGAILMLRTTDRRFLNDTACFESSVSWRQGSAIEQTSDLLWRPKCLFDAIPVTL